MRFQSTLPGWGATSSTTQSDLNISDFNPRSPDGERQHHHGDGGGEQCISIHAPRMGSDFSMHSSEAGGVIFQSTLPGWGATSAGAPFRASLWISIHAPRMGSDRAPHIRFLHLPISIHAPRMGSDLPRVAIRLRCTLISIHAPRMGSDRENGHLRPRYGQNHPFSTLIVSQIVVDVLGTVRKSQKHQRTSHYEVIKQPERQK